MTQDEATQIAAKLFAAYANEPEQLTFAVYVEAFMGADHAIGTRAVDELIASEKWLPKVAEFNEVCFRLTQAAIRAREARALPEPPMSDEQRAKNLARLEQLKASLFGAVGRRMPRVSASDIQYERDLDEKGRSAA